MAYSLRTTGLLALTLVASGLATAQVPTYNSLEVSVASSTVIIVAKVQDVLGKEINPDGTTSCHIDLNVSRRLQGETEGTIGVTVTKTNDISDYSDLSDKGRNAVWFLNGPFADGTYTLGRMDDFNNQTPKKSQTQAVLDMSYHLIESLSEEVSAIQKFIKENPLYSLDGIPAYGDGEKAWLEGGDAKNLPKVIGYDTIPVSLGREFQPALGGVLVIPVVPSLEAIAVKLITHPESVVSEKGAGISPKDRKAELTQIRAEGLKALMYFKSPENVNLAKKYASDTSEGPTPNAHPVQEAAKKDLEIWKIAPGK